MLPWYEVGHLTDEAAKFSNNLSAQICPLWGTTSFNKQLIRLSSRTAFLCSWWFGLMHYRSARGIPINQWVRSGSHAYRSSL